MDSNENLFSVGVHFVWISEQPVAGMGCPIYLPHRVWIEYAYTLPKVCEDISFLRIRPILIPTMRLQITELRELAHITLTSSINVASLRPHLKILVRYH